jgi:molecular chaperone GrpE
MTEENAERRASTSPPDEQAEVAAETSAERGTLEEGESTGEAEQGAEQELTALRDRFLRLAAEYDNFRKRTDRERAETWDRAQANIVERLLEPVDDLERVAQFTVEGTTVESLLEGVRMVERKLLRELEGAGLEQLDARGKPFDPELHDAMMTAPTEHPHEDETVGEVFLPGYRFRGVLLRPARVQVKKHGG